jgi:hypothetical protein
LLTSTRFLELNVAVQDFLRFRDRLVAFHALMSDMEFEFNRAANHLGTLVRSNLEWFGPENFATLAGAPEEIRDVLATFLVEGAKMAQRPFVALQALGRGEQIINASLTDEELERQKAQLDAILAVLAPNLQTIPARSPSPVDESNQAGPSKFDGAME